MIIDSHCHLDKLDTSHYTDGFAGLIAAAQANDVSQMLCISVDTEKFDPMMAQIAAYDFIHASAGLHPLSVKHLDCLGLLELQAQHPKVVAIGETGLDYFYQQDNAALQQQAFIAHLQLSKRLAKPVIVHTRSANEDTLRLLREEADQDVGGVIHCFTEDWAMAEACLDLGFYISISGIVTFNSANDLREVVKKIPKENKKWNPKKPDQSSSTAPFKILNLGNGKRISLLKYIKVIEKNLDKKAIIKFSKMQQGDIQDTLSDIKETQRYINFKPKTSLENGISIFVKWYKNYYK